jgi:hypothetical protein
MYTRKNVEVFRHQSSVDEDGNHATPNEENDNACACFCESYG